jgi:hypothetical protein
MSRCVLLVASLLALALADVPASEARDGPVRGAIRGRITRLEVTPNTRDLEPVGRFFVEWQPEKPGGLDRGFVQVGRRTEVTLDGRPARFEDLRPGMEVEFLASSSALLYPPIYSATAVHAFSNRR